MAITTYSELKTAIANWLNRDDLTSVIPDFIALAETDFNRKLRTRQMIVRATATLADQYISLPSDFLEIDGYIQLNSSPPRKLTPVSPEQMQIERRRKGDVPGIPDTFTVIGDALEVNATPNQSFEIEMAYFQKVPALSATNTSNWLLQKHPDLYLYGALMQAANYIWEDERLALMSAAYGQLLERIAEEDRNAVMSGGTPRQRFRAIG